MTRLGLAIGGLFALAGAAIMSVTTVRFVEPEPPRAQSFAAVRPAPIPGVDPSRLSVPVAGVAPNDLLDTWGQARAGGARTHEAIDIAAPGGTPVIAAAPGRVEKLFLSEAGGNTVYIRSPDRRLSFYYAHLQQYASGLREGESVQQGQLIGYVGDTGNAGAGNTHLHFGVARMRAGDEWHGGEPVNPYPLLAGRNPRE